MIFDDLIFMIFGDFCYRYLMIWFLMIFNVIFWGRETSIYDTTGFIFPTLIQDHQKSWS